MNTLIEAMVLKNLKDVTLPNTENTVLLMSFQNAFIFLVKMRLYGTYQYFILDINRKYYCGLQI